MKKTITLTMWILVNAIFLSACASSPSNVSSETNMDFEYQLQGQGLQLIQAFDDGTHTYFQIAQAASVPAVFVDNGNGWVFAAPEIIGHVVKVPVIGKRFLLKHGSAVARVLYSGNKDKTFVAQDRPDASAVPTANHYLMESQKIALPNEYLGGKWGRDQKQLTEHHQYSYSDRVRGDKVTWTTLAESSKEHQIKFHYGNARVTGITPRGFVALAKELASADRVELIGYEDGSDADNLAEQRVSAVANALAAGGVPRSNIKTKIGQISNPGDAKTKSAVIGVSITAYRSEVHRKKEVRNQVIDLPTTSVDLQPQLNTIDQVLNAMRDQKITPAEAQRQLTVLKAEKAKTQPKEILSWELRKSDGEVKKVIQRWAKDSGFEVVFHEFPVIEVNADHSFDKSDFVGALEYLISQTKLTGVEVPLIEQYTDNVIVFGVDKEKK